MAMGVCVFLWAKLRLVSGLPKTAYAEKEAIAPKNAQPEQELAVPEPTNP